MRACLSGSFQSASEAIFRARTCVRVRACVRVGGTAHLVDILNTGTYIGL